MEKNVGLWIDHREAVIVSLTRICVVCTSQRRAECRGVLRRFPASLPIFPYFIPELRILSV
jgi:hypothetical protein